MISKLKLVLFVTFVVLLSAQKRENFNPTVRTRLSFAYNFSNPSTMIAVILTTAVNRTNNVLYFDEDVQDLKVPRIMSAVKVNPDNTTYGTAYIPPLKLAETSTNASVHYFRISTDDTNMWNNFIITGSTTDKIDDFPLVGQNFEKLAVSPDDIPALTDYQTVIYNSLLGHDSTVNATCQYSIQYTGIVRNILWNDDPKGQWGVPDDDFTATRTITSGPLEFNVNEFVLLTIVGYRLNIISFDILNCVNANDATAAVTLTPTYYLMGSRITSPKNVTYTSQTATCQEAATRCYDFAISYYCEFGSVRADARCRGFCPTGETTVNNFGDCTSNSYLDIRRGYKTAAETTVSTNTEFDFYVDFPEGTGILTMFWPAESILLTKTALWFVQGSYYFSNAILTLSLWYSLKKIFEISAKMTSIFCSAFFDPASFDLFWTIGVFHIWDGSKGFPYMGLAAVKGLTTDYLDSTGVISYSLPFEFLSGVLPAGTTSIPLVHMQYKMVTDPDSTIMAVSYDSEPLTDDDKVNKIRSFSYQPHNSKLAVNNETFTYFTTFIDCSEPCTVSVYGTGQIDAYTNMRTFLFSMDFGTLAWTYTIPTTFSGLTMFTFTTSGSSDFGVNVVSREYTIFSHGFPLSNQTIAVSTATTVTDATSTSCANGENGVCYSCNEGYFYNPATKTCVETCPTGYLTYLPGRQCYKSVCQEYTVQIEGQQCMPQCDVEGTYYVQGEGCGGQCFKGCPVCSNNTGICVNCAYKDPASSVSQCSHCPPGTSFDDTTNGCSTSKYLEIMGNKQVSVCADLILVASMNPIEELYLSPLTFTWTVTASDSGADISQLTDYLTTQTNKELIVPSSFLASGLSYTFTVQYTNVYDVVISATFTTKVVTTAVPPLTIDGGNNQVLYHYETNILKLRVGYNEGCFSLTDKLDISWSQTSGPTLSLGTSFPSDYWLEIPKCILAPGEVYKFAASVSISGSSATPMTLSQSFRVPPVNFTVGVANGNRDIPAGSDVTLEAVINYRAGSCSVDDDEKITYEWSCEKKNLGDDDVDYDPCADPKLIFSPSVPYTSPNFVIPASYYNSDTTLRIGLVVTRGSDSASTSIVMNVKDSTALLLSLECQNCNLYSYPDNLIFVGDVLNNAGSTTNPDYSWNSDPVMTSAAYQYTYKVSKNYTLTNDLKSWTVNLQAEADGKQAQANLSIPVDPAPEDGTLTVTPSTGLSLGTYYHLSSENWQDDDAPLTYALYYQFGNGPQFRLSDTQKFPYYYTQLPGNASATTLTLKLVVTDSKGAYSSAEANVATTVQGNSLMNELSTLKSAFGDLTTDGSSSVTRGDPIEALKTLSLMAIEMSTFEDLQASYTGVNSTEKNQVINFKNAMLTNLLMVYNTIPTSDAQEIMLQTLRMVSANTVFNNPASVQHMMSVMDASIGGATINTDAETTNVAEIITNIIANFGAAGYSKDDTKSLKQWTHDWLDQLSEGVLNDMIPNEQPRTIITRNFDAYILQTTGCKMVRQGIQTSLNSPAFEFNVLSGSENDASIDCDHPYNLIYYTFNPEYSSEQNATSLVNAQKSLASLQIYDLDGNAVDLPVTYILTGDTVTCPEGCGARNEDGACRCTSLERLSLDPVLNVLFGITEKQKFEVWSQVNFWATVIGVAWLLLTLFLVTCVMPRYCKLERFRALIWKTKFKAFTTAYWIDHRMFGIYCYNDPEISKVRRAFLWFIRLEMLSAFAAVLIFFAKHTEIVDIIKQLIIVTALVPFATVYVIHFILSRLLRNYNAPRTAIILDDGSQSQVVTYKNIHGENPQSQPNTRAKFFIGTLLALAALGGSLGFTWYMGFRPSTLAERNTYAVTLAIAVAIDILIAPFILLFLQYIASAFWAASDSNGLRGFFAFLAGRGLIDIRKAMANNSKVSPKMTEIRKLGSDPSSVALMSKGDAIPEFYGNEFRAKREDFSETEVGRGNLAAQTLSSINNNGNMNDFIVTNHAQKAASSRSNMNIIQNNNNNSSSSDDLSLLEMDPLARQQFIDSLLLGDVLAPLSTKNNDPFSLTDLSLRQSQLPSLHRFGSTDPLIKTENNVMLHNIEEEEKEGIQSSSVKKSLRRGPDGFVPLRDSQVSLSNISHTDNNNPLFKSLNDIEPRFNIEGAQSINDLLYNDADTKIQNSKLPEADSQQNMYSSLASTLPNMNAQQLQSVMTVLKAQDAALYKKNLSGIVKNMTPEQTQQVISNSKGMDYTYQKDLLQAIYPPVQPNYTELARSTTSMSAPQLQSFMNNLKVQSPDQYTQNLAKVVQNMTPKERQEVVNASKDIDPALQKDLFEAMSAPAEPDFGDMASRFQELSAPQLQAFMNNMKFEDPKQYQENLSEIVKAMTPQEREAMIINAKKMDSTFQKELINAVNTAPIEQNYPALASQVQSITTAAELQNFISNMKAQHTPEQYNKHLAKIVQAMTPQQRQEVVKTGKTMDPVIQKDLATALATPVEQNYQTIANKVHSMTTPQLQSFMSNMKSQGGAEEYNKTLTKIVQSMTPQQLQEVLVSSKYMEPAYQKDLANAVKASEEDYRATATKIQAMDSQQMQDFMSNLKGGQQDIQQYHQALAAVVETMTPAEIQQVLSTSKTMDVTYQKDLSKALKASELHHSKLAAQVQEMNPQQLQSFLNTIKTQNPELYPKKLQNIMQAMTPQQVQKVIAVSKDTDPDLQKDILEAASKGSQEYYKNLAHIAQNMPAHQLEGLMHNLKQQGEEQYNKSLAGMFLSMTPQQVQELVNTSKNMDPNYQRELINAIKSSEKYHKDITNAPKVSNLSQLNASMAGLNRVVSQYVPEFELMAARAPTNVHFSKLMASVVNDMPAPQMQNLMNSIKSQEPAENFNKNLSSLLKGMNVHQLQGFADSLPPQDFANILPNISPNQLREYMALSSQTIGPERLNKSLADAVQFMGADEIQGFMSNLRAQGDSAYQKGLTDILQKMTPEQVQATVNHSQGMDLIYQKDLVNAASSLNAPGLYYKTLAGSLLALSPQELQSYMTALKIKGPEMYKKELAGMLLSMTPAQLKQLINTSRAMDPTYFHDMADVLRNSEKYFREIIPAPTVLPSLSFNRIPSTLSNFPVVKPRETEVATQFPEPPVLCSECSKHVGDEHAPLELHHQHSRTIEVQTSPKGNDEPLIENIEDEQPLSMSKIPSQGASILIKGEDKTLRQTLRTSNLPKDPEAKYYKKSSVKNSLNVSQIRKGESIADGDEISNDHPIGETINPLVRTERRISRRPSNPSKFLAKAVEVKPQDLQENATTVEPKKLQESLENLVEIQRTPSKTQSMKQKILLDEPVSETIAVEATTPKRSILKKNPVYSPKSIDLVPLSGIVPESTTEIKKMPGKDETWHIPEATEAEQSTFTVRQPNLPSMGEVSVSGNDTELDATLNENLGEDGKFKRRIVKRSSRRPTGNTRTIDIQTEVNKNKAEESKGETPLGGRPSSSRTLSHQGSAWLAKEDEGQAFKNGKLGETLDDIDKDVDVRLAPPPLNNSVVSKRNMTRSRLDMYRMSAEDAANQDSVTNFREEMDRSRSVRLPGTGLKLGRMASTDTKADFEVKLGKQSSVPNQGCNHHAAN